VDEQWPVPSGPAAPAPGRIVGDGLGDIEADLLERAAQARVTGDLAAAFDLFAAAADLAFTAELRLHHRLRCVPCLFGLGRFDEAFQLAETLVAEARALHDIPSLVDALGMVCDELSRQGRWAEVVIHLAELLHAVRDVPHTPPMHTALQNVGVTLSNAELFDASIEYLHIALRLSGDDLDRTVCYSNLSEAYHYSAVWSGDAVTRQRHLHEGLYAATAALDPAHQQEARSSVTALAHRSMLLCHIGHFDAALADAARAQDGASRLVYPEVGAIAVAAEAVARWQLSHDVGTLPLVQKAVALVESTGQARHLPLLAQAEIDALWQAKRYDDARAVFEARADAARERAQRALIIRGQHVQLGMENRLVEELSESDPLTGLHNRRYLDHCLPEAIADSVPSCVAVVDLDGFKQVNDTYGYVTGDLVLQELAGVLEHVCRRGDSVARLGGDEFVIVLRHTSPGDAVKVFERVRVMVAARSWRGLPEDVPLTISIGVTSISGDPKADPAAILDRATSALRESKRNGRNRLTMR
jgi:diguanylate cyclase (GGDEF)-like protein